MSGPRKTVVALLAMLIAVESGAQAALIAPTEILARQHHQTLQRLAAPAGVEIGLLTGREKGRARDSMLASLASGLTPVVVGTHALLQPDVEFRDLGVRGDRRAAPVRGRAAPRRWPPRGATPTRC